MIGKNLLGDAAARHLATGGPTGSAEEADAARSSDLIDRAAAYAVDGWLAAYREGHISFEALVRGVVAVADAILDTPAAAAAYPAGRIGFIGKIVYEAAKLQPKRGRAKEFPPQFRIAATSLLYLVEQREGLKMGGGRKGKTGFERVAEIFQGAGIPVDATRIASWHDTNSRRTKKKATG